MRPATSYLAYAAGLLGLLAAVDVQILVGGNFGPVFPWVPFVFAAVPAAGLGGLRPCLFTLAAGFLAVSILYVDYSDAGDLVAMGTFWGVGLMVGTLTEALQRAHLQAGAEYERWRVTVASIADAVIVTDGEGRVVLLNQVAEELTGWTSAEASGRHLDEVFVIRHEETGESLSGLSPTVILPGHTTGRIKRAKLVAKDGRSCSIDNSAAPIRDRSRGVPAGMVLVFRDVTREQQAAEALKQSEALAKQQLKLLDHVYDTAPIGMGMVDADLRYIRINRLLATIDGKSAEQCLGRTIREIIPQLADRIEPLYRKVFEERKPIVACEVRGHTPADSLNERHWLVSYYPVFDAQGDSVVAVSSVVLDITERKKSEEALRDADRRKNEFLAMLGHELRNPLAAIQYANQLSQMGVSTDEFDWSSTIQVQLAHLSRLVDDLLDVSRISRGRVELRRTLIDARDVARNALASVQPLYSQRDHTLTVRLPDHPVAIEADATRLEQIVQNLLTNAAKYTDPGGLVELQMRQDKSYMVLVVQDSGAGIAPELLPKVFEPFTQGEQSLDRSQGGLGIGLTLAKQLVELHGGTIDAQSDGLGKGSRFTVRLPVSHRRLTHRERPSDHTASSGSFHSASAWHN